MANFRYVANFRFLTLTLDYNRRLWFIYLGFYVAFNTVQVISRQVVLWAEETSTYSLLGLCTVNCRPTASNYQLSHLRPYRELNPGLRGGRRECYHSATVVPTQKVVKKYSYYCNYGWILIQCKMLHFIICVCCFGFTVELRLHFLRGEGVSNILNPSPFCRCQKVVLWLQYTSLQLALYFGSAETN